MACVNPNTNTLYDLELGDELQFKDDMYALRVPGGWIFTTYDLGAARFTAMTATFAPFNNEFMNK